MKWLANRFTDWLTSPIALLHGLVICVLPLVLREFGFSWTTVVLADMNALTVGSWITQFPLAYSSRRGEEHMLKLMRLMVALAEEIKTGQQEQDELLEGIAEDIEGLS